jgi:transcriptional repressor NrdR
MRCPFCAAEDTQVKDSRSSEDGMAIRRRRYCGACNSRFTTFERIQLKEISVMKKSGELEVFDRDKITKAINFAIRKRTISQEQVEIMVSNIVRDLEAGNENVIASLKIGEIIMSQLAKLDQVAYVRFASVYKEFSKAEDFGNFIKQLHS